MRLLLCKSHENVGGCEVPLGPGTVHLLWFAHLQVKV